jgi:hypothetical protein
MKALLGKVMGPAQSFQDTTGVRKTREFFGHFGGHLG